jgi:hypothetical protein
VDSMAGGVGGLIRHLLRGLGLTEGFEVQQ